MLSVFIFQSTAPSIFLSSFGDLRHFPTFHFIGQVKALKHCHRPDKNSEHRHRKRFPVIYLSSPPILRTHVIIICFLKNLQGSMSTTLIILLLSVVEMLKQWKAVDIPKYDFKSYTNNISRRVNPLDVIILEGILIFHDPHVRDLMNMKIFVHTDVRLAWRIRRNTSEKGRDIDTWHAYIDM
ncbi:unnamed protein product [Lactuca saligna]|uniref:Phosphoribulokinase/uridine kinase domain-containing protein n=1 Tax=Lactuca saligna TaxID=75948 RepID=A0AA35YEL4_LACSI|nr:unnamed protein product [Lactuca saligna]